MRDAVTDYSLSGQSTGTNPAVSVCRGPSAAASALLTRPYWLSEYVYAAVTQEGIVLLDLLQNRYFGLPRTPSRAVESLVSGLPRIGALCDEVPSLETSDPGGRELAEELARAGLLNRRANIRGRIEPIAVNLNCTLEAVGDELEEIVPLNAGHWKNLFVAFVSAQYALKFVPFISIVTKVSMRNSALSASQREDNTLRSIALVCVFRRLRPYFFTAKDRCLLHALTLVNFLAYYGIASTWVIGVKTLPWGAHSWVMQRNRLLDSNPEKICGFQPILAV